MVPNAHQTEARILNDDIYLGTKAASSLLSLQLRSLFAHHLNTNLKSNGTTMVHNLVPI